MKVLKRLERSRAFWFVILTSCLFFLLRLPSLFEPIWYGDEGIYQVIGNSLNNGRLLYSEIFDNKPPLLYWLYAILNSDQFTVRLASLIFGLLSVIFFFFLSKKLFANKNRIHFMTTFIFAILFGLPILEGNIANAENFMLLPILIAAFLVVSQKKYFLAGLLLGIAFLFKIVAIFDMSAFLIFYFIVNFGSLKKTIKFPSIIAGFFLPTIAVSIYFLLNNTFIDFVKAAFLANISYVSYGNKIGGIPILLFIKLAVLGLFTLYLFVKRKAFTNTFLFILLWFAFSSFNALFSQRPYTHYLLVLIPSLSLMIGLILFDKKYQKTIAIVFIIALLTILKTFGIPNFSKSISYYQNFISYVNGEKTMVSYQGFFDRNTPFDYEVARFIKPKLNRNETIFVWGNNAQIYELVGVIAPTKYVVAYHISNYKDGATNTKNAIEKTKPKFIVVMTNSNPIPFPLIGYSKKININKAAVYERIF
ncbi:MAG: glycosyltransferase family 39 protein [Candidatus Levybacteria bacterium]|nr:glycosyltransferase family 39 protein [Candidatus Levybacteria bacterium]